MAECFCVMYIQKVTFTLEDDKDQCLSVTETRDKKNEGELTIHSIHLSHSAHVLIIIERHYDICIRSLVQN